MKNRHKIHPSFRIKGNYYQLDSLCELAIHLIKDGNEFEKELGLFLLEWSDAKNYILLTTSGTTGTPKTIKIKKKAMVASAKATGSFFKMYDHTNALLCLPMKYIAGKMMVVRAMTLGWNLDYVSPSQNPMENSAKKYDFVAMVPLQVQNSKPYLTNIKTLIIGGGQLHPMLKNSLKSSKTNIYETYGMTETVTHIAVKAINDDWFSVLPKIKIKKDKRGCLVIKARKLVKHKIITNDLVEIIDSKHFKWIGRIDHVINSGGIKISPENLEQKLVELLDKPFFIGGLPDEKYGESVTLFIEGEESTLSQNIFEDWPTYEIPKAIIFLSEFLRTESGKIKRKSIIENYIQLKAH